MKINCSFRLCILNIKSSPPQDIQTHGTICISKRNSGYTLSSFILGYWTKLFGSPVSWRPFLAQELADLRLLALPSGAVLYLRQLRKRVLESNFCLFGVYYRQVINSLFFIQKISHGSILKEYENEYCLLRCLVLGRKYIWIYNHYYFPFSKQFQQIFIKHWGYAWHNLDVGNILRIKTDTFLFLPSWTYILAKQWNNKWWS